MSNPAYWRPKPKPKPTAFKGETDVGRRRREVIEEWSAHVVDEHHWGAPKWADEPADPQGQRDCAECAAWYEKIRESETWTS